MFNLITTTICAKEGPDYARLSFDFDAHQVQYLTVRGIIKGLSHGASSVLYCDGIHTLPCDWICLSVRPVGTAS